MKKRIAKIKRKTRETQIYVELNLDGKGKSKIKTGIGFLDHMLGLFSYHGLFDLKIQVLKSDLDVDIHHTNEDVGVCLGKAFKKALAAKKGISRYGFSFVPMDEALANVRVVLDISGRPSLYFNVSKFVPKLTSAAYNLQDVEEFFRAFVTNSGVNVHIDVLKGKDIHHTIEAVFKAFGRALKDATRIDLRMGRRVPSTKGKL